MTLIDKYFEKKNYIGLDCNCTCFYIAVTILNRQYVNRFLEKVGGFTSFARAHGSEESFKILQSCGL